MIEGIQGIVLGEIDKSEKGKTLIVLTYDRGVIYVEAPGAHKISSSYLKSAQLFAYSRLMVYKRKDYYLLTEAYLMEDFFGLRNDYVGFCLASYVAEMALSIAVDKADGAELLSLTLNTLYAINKQLFGFEHIRAVFQLRAACILGFEPDVESCPFCDKPNDGGQMIFDLENGYVCCADCLPEDAERECCLAVDKGTVMALRYVSICAANKIFSFALDAKSGNIFSRASEMYIMLRAERKYKSLDIYKKALKGIK